MAHTQAFDLRTASSALDAGLAHLCLLARDGEAERNRRDTAHLDALDVRRSLNGDDAAFRRLVERHQGRIGRMMWRFSRDPEVHEELVQDVFLEAWRSLENYRGEAPFEHWLARIATRTGYRHWRRQQRRDRITRVPLEDAAPLKAPEELEPSEAGELLHRLLQELSPRDRLVLTLRYLEDRSVQETARLTGWSQSMVKVQAHRARNRL